VSSGFYSDQPLTTKLWALAYRGWQGLSLLVSRWPKPIGPIAVCCVFAALYLLIAPHNVDLAAHDFRSTLFSQEGFALYNAQWYGGHQLVGYSLLFPPLAALAGPTVVGALACVVSAAIFERLATAQFKRRGLVGAFWFAAASTTILFTGRLTFALGVAVGLACVLALQKHRLWLSALFAIACPLASPVAGVFLALCCLAIGISAHSAFRYRAAIVLAATGATLLALAVFFAEKGYEPLEPIAYVAVVTFCILSLRLLPSTQRVLRTGIILYLVGAVLTLFIPNPLGGLWERLGAVFGGPTFVAAEPPGRVRPALWTVLLCLLVAWQWLPAIGQVYHAKTDPTAQPGFYAPLKAFLSHQDERKGRLEVVFTKSHWEASQIAPGFALARGWERQLDTYDNPVFYEDGKLNADTYATWLSQNAVQFVAVPKGPVDYSAEQELALVQKHPPYLIPRWHGPNWDIYEVGLDHSLVSSRQADASVTSYKPDALGLEFRRPGSAVVRVQYSPYWVARGACVSPNGRWTQVTTTNPAKLDLKMDFSVTRALSKAPRCG
jgi:hypothetical protein